jgi:gliding motility-associated-like protein
MNYQSHIKFIRPCILVIMWVVIGYGYTDLKAEMSSDRMNMSISGLPSSLGCNFAEPVFNSTVQGGFLGPLSDLDTLIWGCHQDTIMVDATFPGALSYQWSHTNDTAALIRVYPGRTYSVLVSLADQSFTRTFRVLEDETCPCPMSLPKTFSPNGDGYQDLFGPVHDCNLSSYEMAIYNRWGIEVFYTTNPQELWDGTFDGEVLSNEIFVFYIKYRESELKPYESLKGDVTLLK